MTRVLVVYASSEGQTEKIANTVGEWVRSLGCETLVVDAANPTISSSIDGFDAFVLAGSLHVSKHQPALRKFARRHAATLNRKPTLFLSVSMSAATHDDKHKADTQRCIDAFLSETGLKPTTSLSVAGAVKWSKYGFLTKFVMLRIVRAEGGDTDTTKDREYTDWTSLRAAVEFFLKEHVQR